MTHTNTEHTQHEGDSKRKSAVMILGLILILAVLLVGSYVVSGLLGEPEHAGESEAVLEGPLWVLLSLYGQEIVPHSEVTAQFQDTQITGSSGCNNYFASYEVEGNHISIGPAGSTMMFCEEPEGTMDQEVAYLAALGQAGSFQIHDNVLEIMDAGGEVILVYAASGRE